VLSRSIVNARNKITWSLLRPLGNAPLVRATLIMPLLGYVILLNEDAHRFLRLDAQFFGPDASSPWRLIALYWGFFFTAAGALIFAIFCPSAIKQYSTDQNFAESSLAYYRVVIHAIQLDRTVVSTLQRMSSWNRRRAGLSENTLPQKLIDNFEFVNRAGADQDASVIWLVALHWRLLDVSRAAWCFTSCLFYATGLIVLTLPAVDTLVRVAAATIKAIGVS
jgi:hypothetical protein